MKITPLADGDPARLLELVGSQSKALQRDRYRAVFLAMRGRDGEELEGDQIAAMLGRSPRFVDEWVGRYRRGGLSNSVPASSAATSRRSRPLNWGLSGRGCWPAPPGPTGASAPCGAGTPSASSRPRWACPSSSAPSTTGCTAAGSPASSPGPGTARTTPRRWRRSARAPPFCPGSKRNARGSSGRSLVPGRGEDRPAGHAHRGLGPQELAAGSGEADRV